MTDYFHDLDVFSQGGVLLLPPSFNSLPSDEMVGDQEIVRSGGAQEVVENYEDLVWLGSYNKRFCSLEEQSQWFEFIKGRMGRLRSFWYPSFVSDFTLYRDSEGAASNFLHVIPNNFDWSFQEGRYGLYIETVNDRFIWQIADYERKYSSPFDVLKTKSQLGKQIKKRDVLFMSLIRMVRFNTDKFSMRMETPEVGEMPYSFLELPHEAAYVKEQRLTDDLIVGHDHESSFLGHVMMGAGWFDQSADKTTNTGGDGKRWATNQVGSPIEIETDLGTTSIGIIPNDLPYSITSYEGLPFFRSQPIWGHRKIEVNEAGAFVGSWSSWEILNETPHHDYNNGYWVISDLDPEKRYRIQFMLCMSEPSKNRGDRITRFFEPGQESLPDPFTAETWSSDEMTLADMWSFSGFLVNGKGSLRSFSDTRQKLKVMMYGSRESAGSVKAEDSAQVSHFSGALDKRGFSVSWPQLMIEAFETANPTVRVSLCNQSFEDSYFLENTNKMRAGTTASGFPPLLSHMKNLADKYEKLTNTRSLKSGWQPQIILFGYTAKDQEVAAYLDDAYAAGQAKMAANELWSEFRASWPSVEIFVVPFPRLDADLPDNPWTAAPIAVRGELFDSVDIDHSGDSWIRTKNLDSLGTAAPRSTILTPTEHVLAHGIVFPEFETIAENILGL